MSSDRHEQVSRIRVEFDQLSADMYEQMHEIKRIAEESTAAFNHHIDLLKRCRDLEERLS